MGRTVRRYANKKDTIHQETVTLLRAHSVRVLDIDSATGIDLLCGYKGRWFLLELKSKRTPETKRQKQIRETCEAEGLPYFTLREGEPIAKVLDKLK